MYMLRLLLLMLAAAALCAGCNSIGVNKITKDEWFEKNGSMGVRTNEIGSNCRNYLLANELSVIYDNAPEVAIYNIYQEYLNSKHERHYLTILAELCYVAGMNADSQDQKVAFHSAAAYFSYQYLFGNAVKPSLPPPYDMDVFIVARFYNGALDTLITFLNDKKIVFNSCYNIPAVAGLNLRFGVPLLELSCPIDKTTQLLSCYHYSAEGLYVYSYSPGVGVPLIAHSNMPLEHPKPFKIIKDRSYPTTFFLRMSDAADGNIDVRVELYSAMITDTIKINDKITAPLSVDFSTPLAYDLRNPPLIDGFSYMFNAESPDYLGIFALDRLVKNKIPLVFVHGLMSNPRTWAQMVNILAGDPDIRRNYQFWLFAYSTGSPVLYSAYLLRNALQEAKANFSDPEAAANFNQMVIVSHSMGGLLSKTTIMNSGNTLKEKLLPPDVDMKSLSHDEQQILEKALVFERLEYVQSVVFMATPHQGADMATWVVVRWASSWITLPSRIKEYAVKIQQQIKSKVNDNDEFRIKTGLDNLEPENKMLQALSELKFSADANYYTICGNKNIAGVPGGTDGIVPYRSSHLDSAQSELIVQSGHSVQDNPTAIEAVRKILLQHLRKNGRIK